jgi:FAD/FMN-containing dehydrogenase
MPAIIVMAACERDIQVTLDFVKANGVPFAIRGGGHSALGFSSSRGLVINLSTLDQMLIDTERRELLVGAGFTWGSVYAKLRTLTTTTQPLVAVGGYCSSVGAGFLLGGGVSYLSRTFGLGSDNVLNMTVVLANGTISHVSRAQDSSLFKAMLAGGGGNFGVVTQFALRLHAHHSAFNFITVTGSRDALAAVICAYHEWGVTVSERVSVLQVYGSWDARGEPYLGVDIFGVGDTRAQAEAAAVDVSESFATLIRALPFDTRVVITRSNISHNDLADLPQKESYGVISSYVLTRAIMSQALCELVIESLIKAPGATANAVFEFDLLGGALKRDAYARASWFPWRRAHSVLQFKLTWNHSIISDAFGSAFAHSVAKRVREFDEVTGAYVGYIGEDTATLGDHRSAYYGASFPLLLRTKLRVDPDNLFRFARSISVAEKCSFDDRVAIVHMNEAFDNMLTAMDASSAASLFVGDIGTLTWLSVTVTGRAAIEAYLASMFNAALAVNVTLMSVPRVSRSELSVNKTYTIRQEK